MQNTHKRELPVVEGSEPMNFSVRPRDRAQIVAYCGQLGIGQSELLHRLLQLAQRGRHDLAGVENRLSLLVDEIRTGAIEPLEVAGALRMVIAELAQIAEPMAAGRGIPART